MKQRWAALLVAVALIGSVSLFSFLTVQKRKAKESAAQHFQKSDELQKLGEIDKAVAEMQLAIKDDPQYFEARIGLADLYESAGREKEAIGALEEGMKVMPQDRPRFLSKLGDLYELKKDYPNAIKVLRSSLELAPEEVQVCRQLAMLLEKAKQWDEAEVAWQDFQKRFPTDPGGSGERGLARIKRRRAEVEKKAAVKADSPEKASP